MSRISPDELIRAIELVQLDEVQRLIAEGANPYEPNGSGKTALEAWLDSQTKGNPYAGRMGMALLERSPDTLAEISVLHFVRDKQLANLGQALGVLEHARQEGIDYHSAYIPPQNLESSQACWAAVYQALDKLDDQPPTVLPQDFAWHFAAGLTKGRQHLSKVPGTGKANFRGTGDEAVIPNAQEAYQLTQTIANTFGKEPISVSPRGALMPADGRGEGAYLSLAGLRKPEGHAAAVFHSETIEELANDPNSLAGMPGKVWFPKTPEARLDEALEQKDWARASDLVKKGADVNRLPLEHTMDRLVESASAKETQALLDMGLDPLRKVSSFYSNEPTLPIHLARSQEQFDTLMGAMKKQNPGMGAFEPESHRVRGFWENSPHFVDTRSASAKAGDWVGDRIVELATMTVDTIKKWRQSRQPVAAVGEEPSKPQGPKL